MKIYLILFVILCGFAVDYAEADIFERYEEERIHNAKIERRLASWAERTRQHARSLETSNHPKIIRWRQQMAMLRFQDELQELEDLNGFVNGDVDYIDDYHHYHKQDYWADPETTLDEGGDCEDIALLKAASLYRVRWPVRKVHLLVGFLIERGKKESHAVLLVETSDGKERILRSISDQVVAPGQFPFVPVYGVDQYGTLVIKPPQQLRPKKHEM